MGFPIPMGLAVALGYSQREKPQSNKERPLNVGRQIWKRFLNVETYRYKEGCRDKDIEAPRDTLCLKKSEAKGRWLKDTLNKTGDQRPRITSTP